jgi:hypothetical protein
MEVLALKERVSNLEEVKDEINARVAPDDELNALIVDLPPGARGGLLALLA